MMMAMITAWVLRGGWGAVAIDRAHAPDTESSRIGQQAQCVTVTVRVAGDGNIPTGREASFSASGP